MILLSQQWFECFNSKLVISLYPRHLTLQSNKENFMSRGFVFVFFFSTGLKLTAVSV